MVVVVDVMLMQLVRLSCGALCTRTLYTASVWIPDCQRVCVCKWGEPKRVLDVAGGNSTVSTSAFNEVKMVSHFDWDWLWNSLSSAGAPSHRGSSRAKHTRTVYV